MKEEHVYEVPQFPDLFIWFRERLDNYGSYSCVEFYLTQDHCWLGRVLADKFTNEYGESMIWARREDRTVEEPWPVSYLVGLVHPHLAEE
tara:strand:- start:24277 stop:24546 length:270 start_codon:yes stop_codon:yes gene_type:complete